MIRAEPVDEPVVARARELHARAVDAYASARPAEARMLVRRALRVLGDEPSEARTRLLITLALSTSELDGVAAGRHVLDESQRFAERHGAADLRLLVLSQRGALALRAGDFQAALGEYDAALSLLEHAGSFDRGVILANAATACLYLGELTRGRGLFAEAIAVASAAGSLRQEAIARHNLGYIDFLQGELPRALEQMSVAAAGPELPEGVPLLDRARVLTEAGLHQEAEACLARAAEIFRRDRMAQDLGETEIERSRVALVGGDVAAARRFAARARDRFRRRDNACWRRAAELALLQADLAARRPAGKLVPPALRLRDEFAAEGLRLPARAAALIAAEADAVAGRVGSAADLLARSGPPQRGDPVTSRLQYEYVHALVESENGDRQGASRRVRRALTVLADYQASFGSVDMRSAAAVHGRRLAAFDITLARRGGRVTAVFAAAERARAVTSRIPVVRPPDDPLAAELLAELRQTVESSRAVEYDRAALEPLQRKRRKLEREIVARTWTTVGEGGVNRPAALADVRAELARQGRTMTMYVQDAGHLSAVVVGRRLRMVDLGRSAPVIEFVRRCRADLDVLASPHLPPPLRAAITSSLAHSLAALDTELVTPLGVQGDPLVIISTGVLGQVPWASLPSLRDLPVVVAPSATKWVASSVSPTRAPTVVAIGGPDLGRGEEETARVATSWPSGRPVRNGDRSELLGALGRADLVHVAAHGLHQPENPLFSSLRMADGPLFAHELSGRMPAHVVLSACEVGLATIRPGDEALGLASVLLQLGTSSVVAGVARVNDEQAERVMVAYHRELAGGADSAAALATALAADDADIVAPFVNLGSAWRAEAAVAS